MFQGNDERWTFPNTAISCLNVKSGESSCMMVFCNYIKILSLTPLANLPKKIYIVDIVVDFVIYSLIAFNVKML